MSALDIIFHRGGVHLPGLGLWLDPHEPQAGAELTFISHAHADHIGHHREVILTAPTSKLMQARIGPTRREHVLAYREPARFEMRGRAFTITLLPAGHIFGSAMALIEAGGESLLYTGDFKLRPGLSSERCEPRRADILIMETTFGQPKYQFPPVEEVLSGIIRFCQEALDNDETPVLLGYSLGKSQELLRGLAAAGLPIMLHGAVYKLTQIYEQFGQSFPPYEKYAAGSARGKTLVCPPNAANSAMLRKLGKTRSAILTGWAVEPNCRYRYHCDAAFAMSDHADFPDLIEFVKQAQPKKIYTLHGFAADFAQTLRGLGYDAQALSEHDQFFLNLQLEPKEPRRRAAVLTSLAEKPASPENLPDEKLTAQAFIHFARACSAIAAERRKLEKIRLLAEYFKSLRGADQASAEAKPDAIAVTAHWFTGRPFASSQNKVLQIGWSILRQALCQTAGVDETTFHHLYLKHSDSGETAFELFAGQANQPVMEIEEINGQFQKIQAARGAAGKLPLLIQLFQKCAALEIKYLVKIITGDLRIGLKEGLVEEAIAAAFDQPAEAVRQAHLLLGDLGETARRAQAGQLHGIGIAPFRPVKFMLASPEESPATIWERLRGDAGKNSEAVWLEDKYDGIRCQLHKADGRIGLYSRDLKDITATFFDVREAARQIPGDLILDGEILAMRGEEVLPFAQLQKRLGRRTDDLFMAGEVPIQFVAFDLLWRDGESFLNQPLRQRREKLAALSLPAGFRLAQISRAHSIDEIAEAFTRARGRNNEGLMIKDPESFYTPGRRGLAWLKLKKAYATLDCVVVGAEYGHGKRKGVLSDYTFAVRDEASGELKTIGKAYSGLTDVEIAELTQHFLSRVLRQRGRYHEVTPDTVLEIAFDRIQESDRHTSGMALRFPRILRIRADKSPAEIDTVAGARRLVQGANDITGEIPGKKSPRKESGRSA